MTVEKLPVEYVPAEQNLAEQQPVGQVGVGPMGGDQARGDQVSGDQASGDQASGDQVSGDQVSSDERARELSDNLADVRAAIAEACRAAGRAPGDVTLIAITKTWPADDVRRLARLGLRDVGENRDQEADPKAAACRDLPLTWHMVGSLQRNKSAAVRRWAAAVHSVDRVSLVDALEHAGSRDEPRAADVLDVCVQVSLDGAEGRGGCPVPDVPAVADRVAATTTLRLRGVMAVAPLDGEPRRWFDLLAEVAQRLRTDHPEATWISAGMSGDLVEAIAAGSTHVRIGTALLGRRPVAPPDSPRRPRGGLPVSRPVRPR